MADSTSVFDVIEIQEETSRATRRTERAIVYPREKSIPLAFLSPAAGTILLLDLERFAHTNVVRVVSHQPAKNATAPTVIAVLSTSATCIPAPRRVVMFVRAVPLKVLAPRYFSGREGRYINARMRVASNSLR